ncbi:MAG TPA: DMT family transporter [Candidatus Hydrothermia bacterium]|nr:DMT family transporter [Candidatus Hydrothermia bacterium]MDD5572446.1 DMT family transporter [Candidatus Hydrothermia bacterium]HPO79082.1 DMT family transporter [Candidatus Hydrothermia bacterium]
MAKCLVNAKNNQAMRERQALFLIVLSSIVWSTSFPAVKVGLEQIPPGAFIFLRFFTGTIFYLIFMRITRVKFNKAILKEKLAYLLGLLTFFSYLFQYVGQKFTLASRTALIINLFVLWVPILAVLFLKEKLPRRYGLSLAFLLPGMLLLSAGKNPQEILRPEITKGDFIVLLASICWALYTIISKNLLHRYSAHEVNLVTFGITAALSIPFALYSKTPFNVNLQSSLLLLHLSLGCTVIAYYLYVTGLKYAPATKSTLFVSLEVLFSFLIALIFLGERWAPLELLGGALMLVAVAFAA